MPIYKSTNYRKIYSEHYGPIPKDKDGRSMEIHHIDGNHDNNDISNLKLVTIQEHYEIHAAQGDHAACLIMAQRMKITPEEKSRLAKLHNAAMLSQNRHPLQRRSDGTSHASERVANGTFNMLGGAIQEKTNRRRVLSGEHHWLGADTQQKLLNEGRHASQIKVSCVCCKRVFSLNMYSKYHGSKCKSIASLLSQEDATRAET